MVKVYSQLCWLCTSILFYLNNVTFSKYKTIGIPFLSIARSGSFRVGKNFKINNNFIGNSIGAQKCSFTVLENAILEIGDNVGLSSVTISAHKKIKIGNNVNIGAGSSIYDTDFHSLYFKDRRNPAKDTRNKVSKAVSIGNDVFIGAQSMVLKGVNIGDRSIIGARSLVVRNIPSDEIWAGNPAKFIRKIEFNK